MNTKLSAILSLATDLNAVKALLTWPKFSVTSYQMVSSLAKQGLNPKTVIDIGANVGQFAIAAANLFENVQVYAFEPVPETNQQLNQNIAKYSNITTYGFALGNEAVEVEFNVNIHSQSSSILPRASAHIEAFPSEIEMRKIMVKVKTLDQALADVELSAPTLLKIDAQGYEEKIIRGATQTLKKVDFVLLEGSFKQLYEGEMLFCDILKLLNAQGFGFSRPVGWLQDPRTGEVLQMDALFVRLS